MAKEKGKETNVLKIVIFVVCLIIGMVIGWLLGMSAAKEESINNNQVEVVEK